MRTLPALRDRRPAECLRGRRSLEGALEPRPRRRGEDIQRAHALRVPPSPYPRPVRFDVVVVGGGTAGCVLASRLSENPDRTVCLVEAGPDYGPLSEGRWPSEILDARTTAPTHLWGAGAADGRTLGGKVLGGSSSVNACMAVQGTSADYDEWGSGWTYESLRPFLERARAMLRTGPTNTSEPSPFHVAFVEAAHALGYPILDDLDDLDRPVGAGSFPANVVDGARWNAALAYLDGCRARPNLTVLPDTLVDRVLLREGRAVGVVDAEGRSHEAGAVILAAGCVLLAGDPPSLRNRPARRAEPAWDPRGARSPRRRTAPRPLRRQRRVGAVGRPAGRHGASGARRGALRAARAAEGREQRLPGRGMGSPPRHLDRGERRAGGVRGERHGVPHEAVVARPSHASLRGSDRAPARRAWLPLGSRRRDLRSSKGSSSHGSSLRRARSPSSSPRSDARARPRPRSTCGRR